MAIFSGNDLIEFDDAALWQEAARAIPESHHIWTNRFTPGAFTAGTAIGDEYYLRWRLVSRTEHLFAEPLVRFRRSTAAIVDQRETLSDWWLAQAPSQRPSAICVAGNDWTWRECEEMQARGVMVGRVPAVDAAWWEASARRPQEREPRAWIALGARNGFTSVLHDQFLNELESLLEASHISVDRSPATNAMLVIVLDHGATAPLGVPITAGLHQQVLDSITPGAIVVSFACFGAGRAAGDRYGGLSRSSSTDPDTEAISAFALDCLRHGAAAVVGHVDGTWSGTYTDARAVAEAVRHMAAGATAGYATRLLAIEAQRHALRAIDARDQHSNRAAGEHWLRYLDLMGFACLGDPCARVRTRNRED